MLFRVSISGQVKNICISVVIMAILKQTKNPWLVTNKHQAQRMGSQTKEQIPIEYNAQESNQTYEKVGF